MNQSVRMTCSSSYSKLLYEIKKLHRLESLKVVIFSGYETAYVARKSSGLYNVRINNLPELCDATAEVCARFLAAY